MRQDKRLYFSVFYVIVGAILLVLGVAEKVDAFWSGAGSGLAVVGILQLLRFHRFNKDPEYREKVEIAEHDERNSYIRNKAFAWAGYIFILSMAVLVIVFQIANLQIWSKAASMSLCYMLVLFWVAYKILQRKY